MNSSAADFYLPPESRFRISRQILASHALIHTADGELFREALLHASERCGLETFTAKESELFEKASHTLHLKADELGRRLVHLGTAVGSPWTQDEKLAALVAWLSLACPLSAQQICGVPNLDDVERISRSYEA